uniref:Uncharacterized protein n=1 Tax=Salarias fasciatus TaxID=181472 RepID=A0A672JE02_SALFA
MSGRDPFPSPKFENGFSLSGFRPQQRKPFDKPTHLAQMEEPWSRLHDAATLSSSQRSVASDEQQVPRDSLDFQLSSIYDHHSNFFWSKSQMLYQRDTVSEDERTPERRDETKQQGDIRVWVDPQRCSIYSIK